MKHIAAAVGIGVGVVSYLKYLYDVRAEGTSGLMRRAVEGLIGINPEDGSFNLMRMRLTLPAAAGIGVSIVAAKTHANNYTPKGLNL